MSNNIPQVTLKNLFNELIFKVPYYQRPYSWKSDQINEFWDDIICCLKDNDNIQKQPSQINFNNKHFIGMFLFSDAEDTIMKNVIDGQQRLSTLLILLSLIKSYLKEFEGNSCKELASAIEKNFLSKTNDEGERVKSRLQLGFYDKEFFEKYIINVDLDILNNIDAMKNYSSGKLIKSYEKIKDNYILFNSKINNELKELNDDSKIRFLKLLYYTIVNGLSFVYFEIDTDEKSTIIFETINSRGKQLSEADLIKNYIFSNVDEDKIDDYFQKWNYILENVGDERITDYIKDHYISSYKLEQGDKIKNELFSTIKKRIPKVDLLSYFEKLYCESETYSQIISCNSGSNDTIENLYYKINRLNIERIYPLILSGYQKFDSYEYINFLELIKGFVFRFKIVKNNSPDILLNVVNKLAYKVRYDEEYKLSNFKEELNSETLKTNDELIKRELYNFSPNKSLRKHIFIEIETKFRGQTGDINDIKETKVNVEHILPESNKHLGNYSHFNLQDHQEFNWRLGNLLLVKSKTNRKLCGKKYTEKINILREEINNIKMIEKFIERYGNESDWDKSKIENRSRYIIEEIIKIWSIN